MAVNKVIFDGQTLVDLTSDTVTSDKLAQGFTAHDASGASIVGTMSPGSGGETAEKQVFFYDYDGTELYSYSLSEARALSALPSNPTHAGLTSQGWNWTLAEINSYLTSYPTATICVGQMYVTTSGSTELDLVFTDSSTLSITVNLYVNGTISIDWGDGSSADSITSASITTRRYVSHTYASVGSYTISISLTNGSEYRLGNTLAYKIIEPAGNGSYSTVGFDAPFNALLKHVRIGNNVNALGSYAFASMSCLETITIPSTLSLWRSHAFYFCQKLKSVTLPPLLDVVSGNNTNYAFYSCFSLEHMCFPYEIGSTWAVNQSSTTMFTNCISLKDITLPHNLQYLWSSTFQYCQKLKSVVVPDSVLQFVGNYHFQYCYSLESVVLPNALTALPYGAFTYCVNLSDINVPSSLTSVGAYSFDHCCNLDLSDIFNVDLTSIGTYAFSNTATKEADMSSLSLTSIPERAFAECYRMKSFTLPSTVTSIGNYALMGTTRQISELILPEGLLTIGNSALSSGNAIYNISVLAVTIPSTVTSIGSSAFQYFPSVKEWRILPTTPPTLSNVNAFTPMRDDAVIYVPSGSLSAYQSATNWSTYASKMVEE